MKMSKETKKKGTKKPYQKPEIVYEDFSLSTNIAGTCDVITSTPNSGNCAYPMDTGAFGIQNVFVGTVEDCDVTPQSGDEYNGICYHVPYDTSDLFNS